jgi:mRNA interferase HigB
MRIIARKTLTIFSRQPGRGDSEQPLRAWFREVDKADWKTPADIKARFSSASFVGDDRVVFNIGGNKYRLVVHVNFPLHLVYIRFIGTHQEYDHINVTTV